ncbi:unnamed protein product, partial [marine sediment metagenome]
GLGRHRLCFGALVHSASSGTGTVSPDGICSDSM